MFSMETLIILERSLLANIKELSEEHGASRSPIAVELISKEIKVLRSALRQVDSAKSDVFLVKEADPELERLLAEEEAIEKENQINRELFDEAKSRIQGIVGNAKDKMNVVQQYADGQTSQFRNI